MNGLLRRLFGVRSPSAALRAEGERIGADLARGLRSDPPLRGDAPLLGGNWIPGEHPEREAADRRCGWTHCNGCCGPCPECGHEGAFYGDPNR